ncbi:MAG: rRNA pseudouridine synthase [Actinobacteria bacterium]|nr:rRNA pseudouridine synthase [Actinomycetota bacterium]
MSVERLQRSLARAGFGSRRACEELIAAGRVLVNGAVASLGDRVDPAGDEVRVDGRRISVDPKLRYFALHKPRGVTTTLRDPHAERDLSRLLPRGARVFPVGRLDRDTEGLLLLTNDGSLAHRLTHPRYGIEKEYLAEVDRAPSKRQLAQLRRGVELEDGVARAADARSAGGSGDRGGVRLVMVEGRKREVRRMLDAVGLPVRRLVRTRVGPVRLGRMRPAELRELDPADVRALYRVAGL